MKDADIFAYRTQFEECVFFEYFTRKPEDCPTKAVLLRRDQDLPDDYADTDVSAMWFGWNLALKHVVLGTKHIPQLYTPSGPTCINGHGGVEGEPV